MKENDRQMQSYKILITIAAFVIVVAGMKAAKALLLPFLLSIFIAIISAPSLFWLRRKRIPMGISLLFVVVGILGVGLLIGVLVGASLNDFSRNLPMYQKNLQNEMSGISDSLGRLGFTLSDKMLLKYVDPGAAIRLTTNVLAAIGNVFSNAFLVFLTVVFILLEAASFPAKLQTAFGSSNTSMEKFNNFTASINRYMVIKTFMSLGTGILVTVWLAVLGVDYPMLWGLVAFIFNYVPNLGSIIAAVPAVLLAFIQLGTTSAILAAVGYIVFNLIIGSIIEPRFLGRGLGLSTLVVFLSLIFWGWILGPVGMVLSIPLTMTVKIALSSMDETMWLSTLLEAGSLRQPTRERTE
ncbi:MAG: AI-2E family transporter [Thermodesulfobacteriota bacterium]|nr:AI-2E family transporter [Thermodesulfobacteriota bacterium]